MTTILKTVGLKFHQT